MSTSALCGSSPLTRGKQGARCPQCRDERLIPAHAGKTIPRPFASTSPAAHPRSRGENRARTPRCRRGWGSSPLTRGKQQASSPLLLGLRLIPAHAGKTPASPLAAGAYAAHPRSRGENARGRSDSWPVRGSSPLTRGKRCRDPARLDEARLIPAHAGKTGSDAGPWNQRPAHPRSRGENLEDNWEVLEADGSSPLTRGKPLHIDYTETLPGLIPAHAGKTARFCARPPYRSAHPRSRGENTS